MALKVPFGELQIKRDTGILGTKRILLIFFTQYPALKQGKDPTNAFSHLSPQAMLT